MPVNYICGDHFSTYKKLNYYVVRIHAKLLQLCPTLTTWTAACQTPLSMGILQARIIAYGDYSHEIKRSFASFIAKKAMTNLDSILKSRDRFSFLGHQNHCRL